MNTKSQKEIIAQTRKYLLANYHTVLEVEPDNHALIQAYEAVILDNSTTQQIEDFKNTRS